jgi:hypothetical protein
MAAKATVLGGTAKDVALDAAVFEAEVKPHLVHETCARSSTPRARDARRARAAGSSRRPREAVAPEGHGPRAPGHDPRAAVHGRRQSRSRPACAASTSRSTARPAGPRSARPARATLARQRSRCSTASSFDAAVDEAAPAARRAGARTHRCSSCAADEEAVVKSFRNLERVLVTVPVGARGRGRRLGARVARHRGRAAAVEQRPARRSA